MDSPKPETKTTEPRRLSRRAVVQAGLKTGPVLMSLPTVPAWAAVNQSVNSSNFCDFEQNQQASSCIDAKQGTAESSEFADPFAPPGQGQGNKKDKKPKQGAFLDSGTWLDD
jgi:hypothetical protein